MTKFLDRFHRVFGGLFAFLRALNQIIERLRRGRRLDTFIAQLFERLTARFLNRFARLGRRFCRRLRDLHSRLVGCNGRFLRSRAHFGTHSGPRGRELFSRPINFTQCAIKLRFTRRVDGAFFHGADDAFGNIECTVTKGQINFPLDSAFLTGRCTTFSQTNHMDRGRKHDQRDQREQAKKCDAPPRGSVNEIAESFKHDLNFVRCRSLRDEVRIGP